MYEKSDNIRHNKKTGENFQLTLDNLYGYKGEIWCVLIGETGIPPNFNSGYSINGMNLDIEIVNAMVVEQNNEEQTLCLVMRCLFIFQGHLGL